MSGKRADPSTRAVTGVAAMVAAYGARKLINFAWKQVTGKEPPEAEDPQVRLSEALAWGVVIGAGVHTARLLATRAVRYRHAQGSEPPEQPSDQ